MNGSNEFKKARIDDLEMKLIFRVVSVFQPSGRHTHTHVYSACSE